MKKFLSMKKIPSMRSILKNISHMTSVIWLHFYNPHTLKNIDSISVPFLKFSSSQSKLKHGIEISVLTIKLKSGISISAFIDTLDTISFGYVTRRYLCTTRMPNN